MNIRKSRLTFNNLLKVIAILITFISTDLYASIESSVNSTGMIAWFQDQAEGPTQDQYEKLKLIVVIVLLVAFAIVIGMAIIIQSNRLLKKEYAKNKEQQKEIEQKSEELAIQNDNLKTLNDEKNSVISYVSHDLMTPLVNIEGLCQLIELEEENLSDDQKHYLETIKKVSKDGRLMIHSMLNISKIEQDIKSIELTRENIVKLLQEAVLGLKIFCDEKSIEIEISSSNDDLEIETDKQYLKQIFSNLISNAIKFSPSGTKVEINVEEKDATFTIDVKDQGEGISERDQDRIFLKYEQVSSRPSKDGISSGLGLAIVKQLIDKLNGKIRVKSEPDRGSTFTVEFMK